MKRVVEVIEGNNRHYEVERKILFWWESCTYDDSCIDGLSGFSPYKFKTVEEAELFMEGKSKNIIKNIK